MTRKDYELIAAAIREEVNLWRDGSESQHMVGKTAKAISTALAKDNPRFDRDRFLRACGIEV